MAVLRRNLPSFGPQESLYPFLFNFRIFLLKFVREAEGDDRKTGLIGLLSCEWNSDASSKRATNLEIMCVDTFSTSSPNRTMDIAQHSIVAGIFQSTAQKPRVLQIIKGNLAVALETKMQEIEVLSNDRRCRSRKIEGK